jgi:hypothetical protein
VFPFLRAFVRSQFNKRSVIQNPATLFEKIGCHLQRRVTEDGCFIRCRQLARGVAIGRGRKGTGRGAGWPGRRRQLRRVPRATELAMSPCECPGIDKIHGVNWHSQGEQGVDSSAAEGFVVAALGDGLFDALSQPSKILRTAASGSFAPTKTPNRYE